MNKYRSRYNHRRRFVAIIFLMVMMMQMGFRMFHLHHYEAKAEVVCSDCEHNRVHGGHILAWDGHSNDCTLCQMLQSPYIPACELHYVGYVDTYHVCGITTVPGVKEYAWCHIFPRGSPSLLL